MDDSIRTLMPTIFWHHDNDHVEAHIFMTCPGCIYHNTDLAVSSSCGSLNADHYEWFLKQLLRKMRFCKIEFDQYRERTLVKHGYLPGIGATYKS